MRSKSLSSLNMNTPETWERYMRDGWEKNNGREQTGLFAYYFLNTVQLPSDVRSLLDVGCAMGDALQEIWKRYPHLQLFGCDVSSYAIAKASETYGNIATFENWGFDEIVGYHDIIYCSATLEHFENYLHIACKLLTHCKWLYVLVPYLELRHGQPLKVEPGQWHVATFDKHSFDQLLVDGYAARIRKWVKHTPGAWGSGPVPFWQKLMARLTGRTVPIEYRMIFFEILSSREAG